MAEAMRVLPGGADVASAFERILGRVAEAAQRVYGPRLLGLGVFGSVGRGTMTVASDIDLILIADPLPLGRVARREEFDAVESALAGEMRDARRAGMNAEISPVIKTPEELMAGSPILFDMTDDLRILYDPAGVLADGIASMRERLRRLGARRIWKGESWYWNLKPDMRPGEEFEI